MPSGSFVHRRGCCGTGQAKRCAHTVMQHGYALNVSNSLYMLTASVFKRFWGTYSEVCSTEL